MMTSPLTSVVIPTHSRPKFLPRAVDSALAYAGDSVEVIVVPNGPDQSWQHSLACYAHDSRVIASPIEAAHGNVARNHGMSLASGKYIRFLDDDDYLLPAASRQVELLDASSADICSGLLANVAQDSTHLGQVSLPDTQDFLCAAVSVSGFRLPASNLFNRKALAGCRWDTRVSRAQDYAWMMDLAAKREWHWVHVNEEVGVWFQHDQARTSNTGRLTSRESPIVERLIGLHGLITREGRSNEERNIALAQGLWYYVHRGFPNHPFYWSHIAYRAMQMAPGSRPRHELFNAGAFSHMSPLLAEWLLLPARKISQTIRAIHERQGRMEFRRQL